MSSGVLADPVPTPPAPLFSADLWPHRSLSPKGFAIVLVLAAAALGVPLLALSGGGAFLVILGFCAAALGLLALMIALTYRSGRLREHVAIWPDRLRVDRIEPSGARKSWEANPHWVRVKLVSTQRVEDYLILSSAGREIELGAFLTPAERRTLADALRRALAEAAAARP